MLSFKEKSNLEGVSIICNTYNHVNYIKQTIESFLAQKTNFPCEILIHDDASIDGTQQIIKLYADKFPDLIFPLYEDKNQYSQGISITRQYQIPRIRGSFIAICEGDDYWNDTQKLQKQFDALHKYRNIDMCACGAKIYDERLKKFTEKITRGDKEKILSTRSVIIGGGGYLATNSLFYRSYIENTIPQFRLFLAIDYTLQVYGSLRGGIIYLPECMAVYRRNVPGSWTINMRNGYKRKLNFKQKMLKTYKLIDSETHYKYHFCILYCTLKDLIKYYILKIFSIIFRK